MRQRQKIQALLRCDSDVVALIDGHKKLAIFVGLKWFGCGAKLRGHNLPVSRQFLAHRLQQPTP